MTHEEVVSKVTILRKDERIRNWLELPKDVLSQIFIKLGGVHTRYTAGRVCSSWRHLSKQPHVYRSLVVDDIWDIHPKISVELLAQEVVVRSHGQLKEFVMENSCSLDLLQHVIEISNSLESISLCDDLFSKKAIGEVGRSCPTLKYIQSSGFKHSLDEDENNELVFAIAKNMPQLRALHLADVVITSSGLRAILDRCLHLECLDIGECPGETLALELMNKAAERIKCLRLPENCKDQPVCYSRCEYHRLPYCSSRYWYLTALDRLEDGMMEMDN